MDAENNVRNSADFKAHLRKARAIGEATKKDQEAYAKMVKQAKAEEKHLAWLKSFERM